ncbi:DUF5067 domain-containing protein [Staphylococcus succinus]|uniref:DUF5067 domain-containing protein n=1 Tax=Staphylococcus succinus TaxID=61015 RepID=UPI000E67B4F5|nr:DUF5067 domain-containing protein [Staphylococcus succinus]RIN36997.1 DUF5067 domain-containing protein [Staphylococcus succinus]
MKKLLGLLLASTLVLGACGNKEESKAENKTKSVNENKTQFKNDTLVIDDAVLKIKDTFLVNDANSDDKLLAFKYEVKNKTDKDEINPRNVWLATMNAEQDGDNTVNTLEQGATPLTGKFEEWGKHLDDKIKKNKSAKGIVTYSLENDKDVTLKATQGVDGKELGTKKIKINDLKTVNYDAAEDINNTSSNNNETSDASSSNKEANSNNEDENTNVNLMASNGASTQSNETTVDNNVQQESNQNQQVSSEPNNENAQSVSNKQSQPSEVAETKQNQTNNESNRIPYDKDHPTLHDESQMEQVPQQHSGGHPSAFDSTIPKESQGVKKVDENGDEYIDATGF